MSSRLDPSWFVLHSYEPFEANRCVDLFRRPDGTFGFEEFRRDPEDQGRWTPLQYFSHAIFDSEAATLVAACDRVAWLREVLDA